MDPINLLTTIIEINGKHEEISEETSTLGITCTTLLSLIQDIDVDVLPEQLQKVLEQHLSEAKQLIEEVSKNENSSWLNKITEGIKCMIPGSKLQQIKDKNLKLIELTQLISLQLQSNQAKFYKKQNSEQELLQIDQNNKKQKLFEPTLIINEDPNDDLLPTLIVNDENGKENKNICELVLYTTKQLQTKFEQNDKCDAIQIKEDVSIDFDIKYKAHNFGRENFLFIPISQQMSRDHATIYVKKYQDKIIKKVLKNFKENSQDSINEDQEQNSDNGQQKLDQFATIQDQDCESLFDEVEEIVTKYEFFLQDNSGNGTYILKEEFATESVMENKNWQKIKKKQEIQILDGDVIGLIMNTKNTHQLILGYKVMISDL